MTKENIQTAIDTIERLMSEYLESTYIHSPNNSVSYLRNYVNAIVYFREMLV